MKSFALFDYGFRPFFLAAGIQAALVIPVWMYVLSGHGAMTGPLPAMYWHAHEMLYGFVVAAIAGFLLTAVPSWTGARGFAGAPLYVLAATWLAGRLAMACAGQLPFWMVALAELAMLPTLAALLAPPLLRSRNRNLAMLLIITVLWLIDAGFLLGLARGDVALLGRMMTLAIDIVLLLVTVIGGRIVPAFTANAIRRRGAEPRIRSRAWLETTVIAAMIGIAAADFFSPGGLVSGALAVIAALAHALRLSGWRSFQARGESILWVLHLGYAWLPIGLALKACYLLGDFGWAAKWQHALTVGVFGTMILAVMTRASLGHTGRPLEVARPVTAAYVLIALSAVARVAGGLMTAYYMATVYVAATAWVLAFLLYLWVYAPILAGPRVDGKPG